MDIDKDNLTIAAIIGTWLGTIFLGGRSYEKLSSRIGAMEGNPPCVPVATCEERRLKCGQLNNLQFAHGAEIFAELKKEIAETRAESKEQHKEIMSILRGMNQ